MNLINTTKTEITKDSIALFLEKYQFNSSSKNNDLNVGFGATNKTIEYIIPTNSSPIDIIREGSLLYNLLDNKIAQSAISKDSIERWKLDTDFNITHGLTHVISINETNQNYLSQNDLAKKPLVVLAHLFFLLKYNKDLFSGQEVKTATGYLDFRDWGLCDSCFYGVARPERLLTAHSIS